MSRSIGGVSVSDIGIGTWGMGGTSKADYRNDQDSVETLRYALSKGINLIDTAEMYAAGHSEELVGKSIQGLDRKKIFITTKIWHTHLHKEQVRKSTEESLKRLGTDYVDLLLIHWPNSSVPIKETIAAMEEMLKEGKTRFIGVSNFDVQQTKDAMEACRDSVIAANQIEYNYWNRGGESSVISYCEEKGISVIAYSPINRGKIDGSDVLNRMAHKYSCKPVQMSLRYVMERSIPIPKTSDKKHLDDLLGALNINISKEDYNILAST
ncbi:MAG: aldo/keto reductase [Thermoplasmataceae archaeon]|jgi:diketogulonate reductase-like aldo/keto reductase